MSSRILLLKINIVQRKKNLLAVIDIPIMRIFDKNVTLDFDIFFPPFIIALNTVSVKFPQ